MKKNVVVAGLVILVVGTVAWLKNAQPASDSLRKPLPRLVELGAGKCKGCRKMAPIIEEVKAEYAGKVIVESIDVIKQAERARSFNWRLIPCQVFIDANGKEVWRHEGFLPKEVIVAEFKEMGV